MKIKEEHSCNTKTHPVNKLLHGYKFLLHMTH